jgi:hypothetical protein
MARVLGLLLVLAGVGVSFQGVAMAGLFDLPGPSVAVVLAAGAPGDGSKALAQAMEAALPRYGLTVPRNTGAADYRIITLVRTKPQAGGKTHVQITWHILTRYGQQLGNKVVQRNNVDTAAIKGSWGIIAVQAAESAAAQIAPLIKKDAG